MDYQTQGGQFLINAVYPFVPVSKPHPGAAITETVTPLRAPNDEQQNTSVMVYQNFSFPVSTQTVFNGCLIGHDHVSDTTNWTIQSFGTTRGNAPGYQKHSTLLDRAIGILSALVYRKPHVRPTTLEELYQEAFQAIHSGSRAKILMRWIDITQSLEAQKEIVEEGDCDPFTIFFRHYSCCCCQDDYLKSLFLPLRNEEIELVELDRVIIKWCIAVRKLQTCYHCFFIVQ